MNQNRSIFFLMLAFATDLLLAAGLPEAVFNPHSMSLQQHTPQCLTCHQGFKQMASMVNMGLVPNSIVDGIKTCITCHESAAVEHMVGARPDFDVPDSLPLDEQGRITCLTCHYTHGPLHSDKPWVKASWFEQLRSRERLHKTFLLRRNNTDGGLCMACHNT